MKQSLSRNSIGAYVSETYPHDMLPHLQLVLGLFPDAMYATRSSLGSGTVRLASAEGAFE